MISFPGTLNAAMIGDSAAMRHVRAEIALASKADIPVLLHGETGTGKELVAIELHRHSGRSGEFVPVNACAPSEGMFESAMFGHEVGAFTGAFRKHHGFFAEAHRGTLFLDEVCSLARDAQAKLLRVIDTQAYRSVGGRADVGSSFRLVTATNRSLPEEMAAGRFRSDLFYRLLGFEIELPPLRSRREDIVPLIGHFLTQFDSAAACPREFTQEAHQALLDYDWPGNVRELRHLSWLIALRAAGATRIERSHLASRGNHWMLRGAVESPAPRPTFVNANEELRSALERHGWNTNLVAAELRVTRKTVYERMKRAQLPTRRHSRAAPREFPAT